MRTTGARRRGRWFADRPVNVKLASSSALLAVVAGAVGVAAAVRAAVTVAAAADSASTRTAPSPLETLAEVQRQANGDIAPRVLAAPGGSGADAAGARRRDRRARRRRSTSGSPLRQDRRRRAGCRTTSPPRRTASPGRDLIPAAARDPDVPRADPGGMRRLFSPRRRGRPGPERDAQSCRRVEQPPEHGAGRLPSRPSPVVARPGIASCSSARLWPYSRGRSSRARRHGAGRPPSAMADGDLTVHAGVRRPGRGRPAWPPRWPRRRQPARRARLGVAPRPTPSPRRRRSCRRRRRRSRLGRGDLGPGRCGVRRRGGGLAQRADRRRRCRGDGCVDPGDRHERRRGQRGRARPCRRGGRPPRRSPSWGAPRPRSATWSR